MIKTQKYIFLLILLYLLYKTLEMNVMNTLDSLFLCKYLISPTADSLFYTEFLS